jgi:single-strand DNA-binding protein
MLQVIAAGRLGKDARLGNVSGKAVLNFSVGTDVGFGQNKKTVWVECAIWGDRATKLEPFLKKGQAVTAIGEGDMRSWQSANGSGVSLTCNVQQITLQGGGNGQRQEGQQGGNGGGSGWEPPADLDDDIPF